MTPTEIKAKELVEKFDIGEQLPNYSIKHSIICVEEIINHYAQVEPYLGVDFWQQVLTHLKEM